MMRINLHIDPTVSPYLYECLHELVGRQRAERLRLLATLGLSIEEKAKASPPESASMSSTDTAGLADADIAKIFGEG